MRVAILGTGSLALATARLLIEHGHEVVVVEKSQDRVEQISEELDCGFMVGDASRPAVLKDVGPKNTQFLFCLADDDKDNIIAALVGRSLGFGRVVTSIKEVDFAPMCAELGLTDAIFLDRSLARELTDMVEGIERAELSAALRGGLRFYSFRIAKDQAGPISKLAIGADARLVAVTRAGKSHVVREDTELKEGDEILIIGPSGKADSLREAFAPPKEDS
jgi:trk system potassium uptake protein TrkA